MSFLFSLFSYKARPVEIYSFNRSGFQPFFVLCSDRRGSPVLSGVFSFFVSFISHRVVARQIYSGRLAIAHFLK